MWLFLTIFFALGILLYNACIKYVPFFLHNTVYYCREVLQSISMQPIRLNMKFFILVGFTTLAIYIVVKVSLTMMRIFQQYRRLEQKTIKTNKILSLTKKIQLENKVSVIDDSEVSAFCFGLRNPKIFISTQMLAITTPGELEAVLRHEKYHLEHNDTLVMLFAVLTQSLFPFFPLLSDFISMYKTQREIKADNAAIIAMDKGKKHIRSVLSKLLHYDLPPSLVIASGFMEANTLEMRIRTLVDSTKLSSRVSIKNLIISLVSVAILGGLTMVPVQAIEFHDMGEDAVMACVNTNGMCTNACRQNVTPSISVPQSSGPYSPVIFTSVSY